MPVMVFRSFYQKIDERCLKHFLLSIVTATVRFTPTRPTPNYTNFILNATIFLEKSQRKYFFYYSREGATLSNTTNTIRKANGVGFLPDIGLINLVNINGSTQHKAKPFKMI